MGGKMSAEYYRNYYQRNRERKAHLARVWGVRNRDKIGKTNRERYQRYYKLNRTVYVTWRAQGCSECGATDNIHAHHLRDKEFTISHKLGHVCVARFSVELAKCVPLCATCHYALHARQRADGVSIEPPRCDQQLGLFE